MAMCEGIHHASARVDKHGRCAVACDAVTVQRMCAMKVLWIQDEASCRSEGVTVPCVWSYLQRCAHYGFVVRALRAGPIVTM